MRKAVALLALVVLAGLGALVAFGQASAVGSGKRAETAVASTSSGGTTESSSVVVHSSSSCSVSVSSVNGVTTTTKSAGCDASSACSVSVSSVNGVTTTTKTGDCADGTVSPSRATPDLSFLRALIDGLLAWFRFAFGM